MSADAKDASTRELLERIKQCIVEGAEFPDATEVLSRIMSGRMTQAQFDRAQREGFEFVLPQMLDAYKAGYYFGCQGLDFLSCLMLSKDHVEEDQRRWNNMLAAAQALGRDLEPVFTELQEFASTRIQVPYDSRRVYITGDKVLKRAGELTESQRKTFRALRERFLTAAMKWNWRQLSSADARGKAQDIEGA